MDSNKDEALRCISIAKEAIALGNKQKALKFIEIAQHLNHNLSVDDLLAACENLVSPDSASPSSERNVSNVENGRGKAKLDDVPNGERIYTADHLQLIRQIMSKKDYYAILDVQKSCPVEEIKKAYRKLSLKIHPDKNKAPGSEEAFKKVSKAFKCLSDEGSRRQYDQTGLVDEFEYNQQCNVRRRRRRTANDLFDDDFDPDEIFRAFFGQTDMFRTSRVYRTRAAKGHQREGVGSSSGHSFMLVLQLTFLLIVLLAYLPFSEPEYSLQKGYPYQFRKIAGDHGVEYFVKSAQFDQNYPLGSPARDNIEDHVIKDYKNLLGRYCHIEFQRRQWNRNYPTPHCDRLQKFIVT